MKIENEIFDTAEVALVAGVPVSTLRDWIERCIVTPTVRPPNGQGRDLLFTFKDCAIAGFAGALRRLGVSLDNAKEIADELRRVDWERASKYMLLRDGKVMFTNDYIPFAKMDPPIFTIIDFDRAVSGFRSLVSNSRTPKSTTTRKVRV
jgi:hypothetical protein